MPDREKVIHALETCIRDDFETAETFPCRECDYSVEVTDDENYDCMGLMIRDALALLREQEPLTIHDPGAICPNCKWPLYPEDHPNYCGNCGKAVKWDA